MNGLVAHCARHCLRAKATSSPGIRACPSFQTYEYFHSSRPWRRVEHHRLTDIGEGVKEVQVIRWYVQEGSSVNEWDPLCEVQSDKATVDITSKFGGRIQKIHFGQDAIVQTGDVLVDIDVAEDGVESNDTESTEQHSKPGTPQQSDPSHQDTDACFTYPEAPPTDKRNRISNGDREAAEQLRRLSTPAVRSLLKGHGLSIEAVQGTGKDGRVLKEDVLKLINAGFDRRISAKEAVDAATPSSSSPETQDVVQNLTPVQLAMTRSMTASMSIPHFLYTDTVDVTNLHKLRRNLEADHGGHRLSYLPFIVKSLSLALNKFPILNARLNMVDERRPHLVLRQNHNIGIAIDTPAGLVVPVIQSVQERSVLSIAQELRRLAEIGQSGKLGPQDLSGGTITVSNIGSIGGEVVGPVIVEGQSAILGVGKVKQVPRFRGTSDHIEKRQELTLSWSADHRVIDGATMARASKVLQLYLEQPATMLLDLR